jgi:hypothetical protein
VDALLRAIIGTLEGADRRRRGLADALILIERRRWYSRA